MTIDVLLRTLLVLALSGLAPSSGVPDTASDLRGFATRPGSEATRVTPVHLPVAAPLPPVASLPGASRQSRKWTATHCEPTPDYCQDWGGGAHLAAVRSFTWGDEPYWVRVEHVAGGQVSTTTVLVVSNCGCTPRVKDWPNIDLSPAAFRELGPMSLGVLRVTVTRIDGVPSGPTLPPTSTEGDAP